MRVVWDTYREDYNVGDHAWADISVVLQSMGATDALRHGWIMRKMAWHRWQP